MLFTPIALRKTKIVCNFGLSECSRINTREMSNNYNGSEVYTMVSLPIQEVFYSLFNPIALRKTKIAYNLAFLSAIGGNLLDYFHVQTDNRWNNLDIKDTLYVFSLMLQCRFRLSLFSISFPGCCIVPADINRCHC